MSLPGLAEVRRQPALSFYRVDSENQTQGVRLGNNCVRPLSHLTSPTSFANLVTSLQIAFS